MQKMSVFQTIVTIFLIFGVTTAVYLYTAGYRLQKTTRQQIDLTRTGMVSAKSIPEGASVYLDGILMTATNDTISGIEPGIHRLKILRKGFVEWQKDIEIFEQLVTDITAVLVSQTPRLEPLTNTGAISPSISPSLTKLAYFSKDDTTPGIWVISLSSGLNLFRSAPTVVLKDTKTIKYSEGKAIDWSPDEKQLLLTSADDTFYLLDLENETAQITSTPQQIKQSWQEKLATKRADYVQKLDISDAIRKIATSPDSLWAPDEKKFLYKVPNGASIEYRVYDLEKPLPVGEKTDTVALTTVAAERQPDIAWYTDSFHLIMSEGDVDKDKRGKISIIRIDGTNKIEIYNNTLASSKVYSAPGGDKLIILTTFKSGDQTDLYTVSIR